MTAAALVVAVSIFSGRMAGKGNDAWFVVPTVAFTAVPMAARLWTVFTVEQSLWMRALDIGPFLIGFAAPVLLLLAVYLALSARRAKQPGSVNRWARRFPLSLSIGCHPPAYCAGRHRD